MEDYIRSLCHKLIEADESSEEFKTIAVELQTALSRHITEIRMRLKGYPLAPERRSIDG
jgi:hypothetical protein